MIRTAPTNGVTIQALQQRLTLMSEVVGRAALAARMGYQYGGDRNLYEALGYKRDLTYEDFAAQYARQAIARAVINRPVAATWQGGVSLLEADKSTETALEKGWKELDNELSLSSVFARLDKLSGIGQYGVLFFGFDDAKTIEDLCKPVEGKTRKLLYIKPLTEGSAEIDQWEENTTDPRYGLPKLYKLVIRNIGSDSQTTDLSVHHTRVLHVAGDVEESEVKGTPRLQAVFNELWNLEKITGGSAEMFWRGARPGYQAKVDPDYEITVQTEADMQTQINEYEHNLRRILLTRGMDFDTLASQVSDPTQSVDVQIQMISAVTGIPKRILTGTERGELASTQDTEAWRTLITARREDFAEPQIVRAFVDICIKYGVLKGAKEKYEVQWKDLWAPSDKEKAEIGEIRANALKSYADSVMAQDVMPAAAFFEFILELDEEDIELINEMMKEAQKQEDKDMKDTDRLAREEAARLASGNQPGGTE